MIIFRRKWYSALRINNKMVQKIAERLDKERIYDYDISSKIPNDVISINTSLNSVEIYLPKEEEYAQFGIDDFIREKIPYIYTKVSFEGDIYVVRVKGKLTFDQYYKLVKYIINEEGFCTILDY